MAKHNFSMYVQFFDFNSYADRMGGHTFKVMQLLFLSSLLPFVKLNHNIGSIVAVLGGQSVINTLAILAHFTIFWFSFFDNDWKPDWFGRTVTQTRLSLNKQSLINVFFDNPTTFEKSTSEFSPRINWLESNTILQRNVDSWWSNLILCWTPALPSNNKHLAKSDTIKEAAGSVPATSLTCIFVSIISVLIVTTPYVKGWHSKTFNSTPSRSLLDSHADFWVENARVFIVSECPLLANNLLLLATNLKLFITLSLQMYSWSLSVFAGTPRTILLRGYIVYLQYKFHTGNWWPSVNRMLIRKPPI